MSRLSTFGAVAATAAAALTLLAPVAASAATGSAARAFSKCETGRIAAKYDDVPIYTGPESNSVIEYVDAPGQLSCAPGVTLAQHHRYSICGVDGGNGYLRVYINNKPIGWTPQACWANQ
jgi:hypothetical protein